MKTNYSELNRFQKRMKILFFFVSLVYLMVYVVIAFATVGKELDAEHKPYTLKSELNTSLLPKDHMILLTTGESETSQAMNESQHTHNILMYPKVIRCWVEGRIN
jgi:hypothetical protein